LSFCPPPVLRALQVKMVAEEKYGAQSQNQPKRKRGNVSKQEPGQRKQGRRRRNGWTLPAPSLDAVPSLYATCFTGHTGGYAGRG
jgi:hypothetical protein